MTFPTDAHIDSFDRGDSDGESYYVLPNTLPDDGLIHGLQIIGGVETHWRKAPGGTWEQIDEGDSPFARTATG